MTTEHDIEKEKFIEESKAESEVQHDTISVR